MDIKEIIKDKLAGSARVSIRYAGGTTRVNGEYINVTIGKTNVGYIGMEDEIRTKLTEAVNELKAEFPDLHIIKKRVELHFYYPGFNSCHFEELPITLSNVPASEEVAKTGKVKETYKMVGKAEVLDIIARYPDYELYERSGFAFRGAQEKPVTMEELVKTLDWMACADVTVVDDEIHVNAFSCNDMW